MRRLLILALLLASPVAFATAPAPIYCIAASLTACSSTAQVGNGTQGDIWWKAFGKFNDLGDQLGIFSSQPANEVIGTGPSGGLPSLESLSSAGIAAFTGTITPGDCAKWSAAGILEDAGACGGGSGTVTDGTGTTTANELLLSSTTAHAYTNATTLPTSALPALTGDVTSPAGSNSVTVSKVNGLAVPASSGLLTTNASSQLTSFSFTLYDLLCGNGPSAPSLIPPNVSGYPLLDGGGTGCPSFGQLGVSAIAAAGTPSSTTFLRGDGQWAAPTGSGTVNTGTSGQVAYYATSTNAVSGLTVGTNTILGGVGSGVAALTPAQAIGVLNSASADATCTTASFTFTLADENGQVTCSSASAQTVTIPPNSSVNFPAGTVLTVQETGAGVVTISPGTGVTITSAAYGSSTSQTYSLGGAYGFIQIQQSATNTWNVVAWENPATGALAAAGTAPSLVAGTNVTITGTWPNQTIAASGSGGTNEDVQVFTSTAGGTWTKPSFASTDSSAITHVACLGAGGGGGGGAMEPASTEADGGAGGGGASWVVMDFQTSSLASTETITVATGGTAGTGATANGAGGNGGNGGGSCFGGSASCGGTPLLEAFGGGGGHGGAVSAGTTQSGAGAGLMSGGALGTAGNVCGIAGTTSTGNAASCSGTGASGGGAGTTGSAGNAGANAYIGGAGGGAGGGLTAASATSAGGNAGSTGAASGPSGGIAGSAGTAGAAPSSGAYASGSAGSGAGSSTTAGLAGGAGGAGSGGGGGFASESSGGNGGAGGNGMCKVVTTP